MKLFGENNMISYKKCFISGLCLMSFILLNACSFKKEVKVEEKQMDFATKIGLAPVNSPIIIAEQTPYGKEQTFIVGEAYNSALGVLCRQAYLSNASYNESFIVCRDENSTEQNEKWTFVPSIF